MRKERTIELYVNAEGENQKEESTHWCAGCKGLSTRLPGLNVSKAPNFLAIKVEKKKGDRVRYTVLIFRRKKPTGGGNSFLTWKFETG